MQSFSLFDDEPRFKKLARRRDNFRTMCLHAIDFAEQTGICKIIETGSAHDKDNWEGQGQSTLIWDWLIENFSVPEKLISALSIDITPKSTQVAEEQTKHVEFVCADSVITLDKLPFDLLFDCGLLYLDSYDWSEQQNIESAFHHMAELAACWRCLPPGCLIVVDDRHGDTKGKHFMVEAFMSHYLKVKPIFKNHQIGFIKG